MISQSEHNIKKSALRFLKMYYKHRPRTGETSIKVNQITNDGIIADGMISFPQDDDSSFVASVEATSFDTRDEVKYQMQYSMLNWDSFMWGSAVAATIVLFAHYFHWFTFANHELQLIAGLSTLFIIVFFIHRYFFQNRTKYRYIYALQQFRRYHADEQWVAIGDNVFYGPEDPALEELRKQCVTNGFGLLSVDKDLSTHLVISPARENLFAGQRKIQDFVSMRNFSKVVPTTRGSAWWESLKGKLGVNSKALSIVRYQRRYYRPMFASILMLGLIGFVAYEDLREKNIDYVSNEVIYDKQLNDIVKNKPFEEFDQKIDTPYIEPIPKKRPDSYMAVVETDKRDDYIMSRAPLQKKGSLSARGGDREIFVESDSKNLTSYDCSRFFNFYGKKYVVQDSRHLSLNEAERRMNVLRRSGFKANLLWLGCFYRDSEDYIVYLEWLYEDKKEAMQEGKDYLKKLKGKKLEKKDLIVLALEKE